ncbi:MAG: hypothetical protein HDS13_00190 [Bacteroides sp.]|nr:hypothetical protein [Bacteroides sp.]
MSEAIVITKQTGAPADGQNIVLSDGKAVSLDVLAAAVRRTIAAGHRNFLLNSDTEKQSKTGSIASYNFSEDLEIGKTYTITACITVGSDVTKFVLGMNGGNLYDTLTVTAPTQGERLMFHTTLTLTHKNTTVNVYTYGGGTITCHWITITEGNIPSAGWFPAPEDKSASGGV